MRLQKVLKEYCFQQRISTRDLADIFKCSHTTVSRFLNGNNVEGELLAKIITWLLEEEIQAIREGVK